MRKRILIIDDEQIVLDSIQKVLANEDFTLKMTTKSREGLELALNESFDLVFTDIKMPDIGGMRILRDIKRNKPALPVLILTGYATVKAAVDAMKLGAADYLEKPFHPETLLKTIKNVLGNVSTQKVESQEMIHHDEVIKVLERATKDNNFIADLFYYGTEALGGYNLTGPEKLAILTGDIKWLEKNIGELSEDQKRWLEQRLSAEIW